jgi:hypothetical protein
MTLLWLLGALLVSGLGGWLSRRWRVLGGVMMILGGLGLIGIIAVQVRQNVFSPEPKQPSRCNMAVSYYLANCVLGDLAGQSGNVVLLFPQRRVMDADTERSFEEGFVAPLRHGRGALHIKALHLEGRTREASQSALAFGQALVQARDALAVVSYAGVPADFATLTATGQPKLPPVYVFDPSGTTNWLGPLKAGQIQAVVAPRPGVDARSREAAAGMPESLLERFYLLVTPANADRVAASLKAQP